MSTNPTLTASRRDQTGKGAARKLRAEGRVPAVVYGKDMDTVALTISAHEALHLFSSIAVASTIVDLDIEGEKVAMPTLVREVQTHPYRPELYHVDFLRIQEGVAVEVDVPLHLEGTPPGVSDQGGVLEQIVHQIAVKCLPSRIPDAISIQVGELMIGDSLHVSDLTVDEDVQILLDADQTIAAVAAPRAEEEPEVEEEELIEGEVPEVEGEAEEEEAAEDAEEAPEEES